jgi:hypothetical protein
MDGIVLSVQSRGTRRLHPLERIGGGERCEESAESVTRAMLDLPPKQVEHFGPSGALSCRPAPTHTTIVSTSPASTALGPRRRRRPRTSAMRRRM